MGKALPAYGAVAILGAWIQVIVGARHVRVQFASLQVIALDDGRVACPKRQEMRIILGPTRMRWTTLDPIGTVPVFTRAIAA